MDSSGNQCRICGCIGEYSLHVAREMMFGSGQGFEYLECSQCGSLFIKDIPEDMSRYYPSGYYSMNIRPIDLAIFFLAAQLTRVYLSHSVMRSIISYFIDMSKVDWLSDVHIAKDAQILDVGCGGGKLLLVMRYLGYSQLNGADPFISADILYGNGVHVRKIELSEMRGQFDLIMLHHSLEHMPDPLSAMKDLHRLLSPGGIIVIRVPLAQTFAWKTYGTNWVQMDPPRHICLFSMAGMKVLAERAGLSMEDVQFDSTEVQFWGSEQYSRGIPLMDARSYRKGLRRSMFKLRDIYGFKKKARELNRKKDGDQACFYLKKA